MLVAVAVGAGTAGYAAHPSSQSVEAASSSATAALGTSLLTADAASRRPGWADGPGSLQDRVDRARLCWQAASGSGASVKAASGAATTAAQSVQPHEGRPSSASSPTNASAGQASAAQTTGQASGQGVSVVAGSSSDDAAKWRQIFSEDFDQAAPLGSFASVYGNRFAGYEGSRDTSKRGLYSEAKTVSVSGGLLDVALRSESGQPLAAALVPAVSGAPYTGQKYGRYEMRFRADSTAGYGMASLLWPDSDDWGEGEVDWPEGDLDGTLWWANKLGTSSVFDKANSNVTTSGGWHTSAVEWTPDGVRFFIDGKQVGSSSHVPTTPFHWVVQMGTTGSSTPLSSAGHVQIDWMRAYAYQG